MSTIKQRTAVFYEHVATGMKLEVIERINISTGKITFPVYEIVKRGFKGDAWVNNFDLGHTFGIVKITDVKLRKYYRKVNNSL